MKWGGVFAGILLLLVVLWIIGSIAGEPEPEPTTAGGPMSTPTVEAAPTPTVETAAEASVATVIPTLTAEEALQQFVRCDRLLAKKSMLWGQAPGVIYSG